MKRIMVVILSAFLPFLLCLGFARKTVDETQSFLPTSTDVFNILYTMPDFTQYISDDINSVQEFWKKTQDTFFSVPDGEDYSDVWSDDDDSLSQKLGSTFEIFFSQISGFFSCFVPFFEMIGACFILVGDAIIIPFKTVSWFWSGILGLS